MKAAKPNGNIMSFFKKTDDDVDITADLFVAERSSAYARPLSPSSGEPVQAESVSDMDVARFNESGEPMKRRKTSPETQTSKALHSSQPRPVGPFLEDSDSEDDVLGNEPSRDDAVEAAMVEAEDDVSAPNERVEETITQDVDEDNVAIRPPLIKEETSFAPDMNDVQDFDDAGDFDEDLFEGGDEYLERKYMEEQAQLEAEDNEQDDDPMNEEVMTPHQRPACPICNANLDGVSDQEADVHVNHCLDGNPLPVPVKKESSPPVKMMQLGGSVSAQQFRRPNRAPKPGQPSPFTFGQTSMNGGSAFNKLMSGHAEDAAWAEAAAREHASRGKPSYERTCPFYKILPGLFICVDAFRYGAVQGCRAYFLSHFHSDHYVGLTSTWSHGPIYCSKVTANLVKQQLRVDPHFVVALEWETPFEIPGTRGVTVTMISANHCPGSSLYLFEKVVGKKQNGEPKLQRILHCGDFRACKMHVEHPLLMPDVQDKVSGKTKEQKIDVCYLDTTYLNAKYAFPSQEVVIKACADMCVCLSKDMPDETDGWEQMKRQRAGEGMVKFVRRDTNPEIKEKANDNNDSKDDMKIEHNPHASQQILSSVSDKKTRGRLLVVVGTYSIGKERICLGIARALNSKIYAPPSKQRIVAALEDPELDARMTTNPREAQVHMTPLFEIRAETLDDYLKDYWPHFTRAVGFRPSGWNYRPPNSRFTDSPTVQTVLYSDNWKSNYSMRDLVPQRGSSSRASCFGVPYSEHSSFRELTMFCCALRIDKIIPTVNVGSAKSRERMKAWCERWAAERRKNGLYRIPEDGRW